MSVLRPVVSITAEPSRAQPEVWYGMVDVCDGYLAANASRSRTSHVLFDDQPMVALTMAEPFFAMAASIWLPGCPYLVAKAQASAV